MVGDCNGGAGPYRVRQDASACQSHAPEANLCAVANVAHYLSRGFLFAYLKTSNAITGRSVFSALWRRSDGGKRSATDAGPALSIIAYARKDMHGD